MDSLARNALRISLAGAGIAVLGAGFVSQASAAEQPDAGKVADGPDSTRLADHVVSSGDNHFSMNDGSPADAPSTKAPSVFDAVNEMAPLSVPGVMYLEAPHLH